MRYRNTFGAGALASIAFFLSTPAMAVVTVGGFNFADDAFVDSLTASSGTYSTSGGSLASVLTDIDADSFAFSFDQGAFVDLAFTDNVAVNGVGTDIVLFELGVPDSWNVTINGVTLAVASVGTGFSAGGFNLNAGQVDLSSFGIAAGGTVNSLRLSFIDNGTVASTSLVGALNSQNAAVPEPATWAMMIGGFGMVGGAVRYRRRTPKVSFA